MVRSGKRTGNSRPGTRKKVCRLVRAPIAALTRSGGTAARYWRGAPPGVVMAPAAGPGTRQARRLVARPYWCAEWPSQGKPSAHDVYRLRRRRSATLARPPWRAHSSPLNKSILAAAGPWTRWLRGAPSAYTPICLARRARVRGARFDMVTDASVGTPRGCRAVRVTPPGSGGPLNKSILAAAGPWNRWLRGAPPAYRPAPGSLPRLLHSFPLPFGLQLQRQPVSRQCGRLLHELFHFFGSPAAPRQFSSRCQPEHQPGGD